MDKSKHDSWIGGLIFCLLLCIGFLLAMGTATAAPKPKLVLSKAGWSAKKHELVIKGAVKQGAATMPITIFDLNGRRLAEATASPFTLTLDGRELPTIPCAVRVRSGTLEAVKKVIGAPKNCLKAPTCQILSPGNGNALQVNESVAFEAKAALKDKKAGSLKTEWDFAGGAMQTDAQRMNKLGENNLKTAAVFLRDNSSYRVRFSATDAKNRRCEDSVEIAVGTPPSGLPDKVAEQTAPKIGNELAGTADDLVVLPFEDLSMQSYTDARLAPNQYVTIYPFNTLNALVYRKARLPVLLDKAQADVVYSAASNPTDPLGAGSINSTSRNWPTDAKMLDAQLQKTDMFEFFVPENPQPGDVFVSFTGFTEELPDVGFNLPQNPPVENDHGSFMPGIDTPYLENIAQSFRVYDPALAVFKAWMVPVTDVDDTGKINPYPLLRVQAAAKENFADQAVTDAVLTSGRDLHCRECHEKGGIAADPNTKMSARYYLRSWNYGEQTREQPEFYEAVSNRIDDRELAAYWNIASIHDFYDGVNLLPHALGGDAHAHHGGGGPQTYFDNSCQNCHIQWQSTAAGTTGGQHVLRNVYGVGGDTGLYSKSVGFESGRSGIIGYDDSSAIHAMHGQFMYNADKSGIRRQPNGRFERWHPEDGPNPNPLFPVKDASGKILPMEENCLKCHGGKREQCYRDRMYTAGVTCYQCHGDMLAVGGFYKWAAPSPDGHSRRLPWFDQPDCGSCHLGNANQGKDSKNGFFSAGVMNIAFDEADPAATLRLPTDGPDGARFAVPKVTLTMDYGVSELIQTENGVEGGENNGSRGFSSLQTPLFRLGKDTHGNVNCAACHGAAHAIWPNRDPSANDNVTALQLQGHTGTILECNVCHTADAFKNEDELDGSTLYSGDPKAGILGGPHNTHPINDPYWWKSAVGDTPNSDGTTVGGWHNNYATKSGGDDEDQCASCHGNDHKGTRLSKTPVDRVFDFSGPEFNFAKLKKAGFKKKIIKVPAGSMIGCDTCHSIKTSCLNSPNPDCGTDKGHADKVNHAPVFTSTPLTEVTLGQEFHDTVTASDPDGDPVTLKLSSTDWAGNQGTLNFDPASGKLDADWASKQEQSGSTWTYTITADDGHGLLTDQTVTVRLACPSGLTWDKNQQLCVKIKFTSDIPSYGLDAGQTFTYQASAVHADGLPLTYGLAEGAPDGMSITPGGLITWSSNGITEESSFYTEVIASDGNGNEVRQQFGFTICVGSHKWNDFSFSCEGPITITSLPPGCCSYGMDVGQTFTFHATATHKQDLPLTFSLPGSPATMNIDPSTGHLEWTPDSGSAGSYSINLSVTDGQGGLARQNFSLTVCAAPQYWNQDLAACKGPISITSQPPGVERGVYGMNVGDILEYDVTATHEQNLPLAFSLSKAPGSMSIDANSGHIRWTADVESVSFYSMVTVAVGDGQGGLTQQSFYITVCGPPYHWNADQAGCVE